MLSFLCVTLEVASQSIYLKIVGEAWLGSSSPPKGFTGHMGEALVGYEGKDGRINTETSGRARDWNGAGLQSAWEFGGV